MDISRKRALLYWTVASYWINRLPKIRRSFAQKELIVGGKVGSADNQQASHAGHRFRVALAVLATTRVPSRFPW